MQNVFQKGKRRFPRRKFRKSLGLLYQGKFHFSKGEEIGEGGMLVSLISEIPMDAVVLMSFIIPGEEIIVARAIIRYQKDGSQPQERRFGLEFTGIGFKQKKRIRDYISAKTEQEAINDQLESQAQ